MRNIVARLVDENSRMAAIRTALLCVAVSVAGCTSEPPSAPTVPNPIRRTNSFMCVSAPIEGVPRDTILPLFGDACPPGYETIPWY